MAISKKGKRKIIRNSQEFYWCVRDSDEDDRLYLEIQSEDRKFSVCYMLGQEDKERPFSPLNPFILVKGEIFKGLEHLDSGRERFLVPPWKEGEAITPAFVGTVIDWCLTPGEAVRVNYRGEVLSCHQ